MNNRQSDWVSEYRASITDALKSISNLLALSQEAQLNNWPTDFNSDLALVGANQDITIEKLSSAMVAANNILQDIDSQELAALYKIRI